MYNDFLWSEASRERIAILKKYEPLQPFFLVALAQEAECGTFLDVGANVGVYSVFMSSLATMKRILAFEPTPASIAEIRRNISLNGLDDRVEVHDKAVSSRGSTVSFGIVDTISGANSIISTSIHEAARIQREVTVECITLDSLNIRSDLPICFKIDVEGHEMDVLRGAEALLRSCRAVLQFENYDQGDRSLFDLLESYGYRQVAHLGPDHYVSNMPQFDDKGAVIPVFERACQMMIDFNHSRSPPTPNKAPSIKWRGPGGVSIHLSGRSAVLASRFLRMLGKKGR